MLEAEIWKVLINYGALGLMVAYLMYDRQYVLKAMITAMHKQNDQLQEILFEIRKK